LTELVFPASASLGLRAYARHGTAVLRNLDVWELTTPVGDASAAGRGIATLETAAFLRSSNVGIPLHEP
jgi:hypothetical protein